MMQRTLFDTPPCPHCGSQPEHRTDDGWHQYRCPICTPCVEAAYGTGQPIEFRWSSTFPHRAAEQARNEWELATLIESTKTETT